MRSAALLTAMACCLANQAYAQAPEERATAREIIAKHGNGVLFVLGTTKIRITQSGKDIQNPDQRIQALVTLLDSTGLGVMSLTSLDPSELLSAQLSRGRGAAAAVTVNTEPADLRYRLPDGRELPVRVVLRDKELDLAFLRPVEKPAAPLTGVDAMTSKPAAVDPVILVQRLPELAGWQTTALFYSVQAVDEKPRTFYFLTGGAPGAPVFDTRGRLLGIVLRLKNEADPANAPFIVLPANDIREVAKQAN